MKCTLQDTLEWHTEVDDMTPSFVQQAGRDVLWTTARVFGVAPDWDTFGWVITPTPHQGGQGHRADCLAYLTVYSVKAEYFHDWPDF